MTLRVTAAKAKAQLADFLRKAERGEPVIITRHGKAVAALVGGDRLELATRSAGGGLAALAGGWEGSEDLVEILAKARRTPARRTGPPEP